MRRHDVLQLLGIIRQEFDIAGSQDADQLTVGVDDRKTGEGILFLGFFLEHFAKRRILIENNRFADQPVQILLDFTDLVRLKRRSQILVNHADAAELCHGNRHFAFRHRIHGGADERDIELDVFGEIGGDIRLIRQKVRILSQQ